MKPSAAPPGPRAVGDTRTDVVAASGADASQAGAGPPAAPAAGTLTELVDELYEQGDNLALLMMHTALEATYRAIDREP